MAVPNRKSTIRGKAMHPKKRQNASTPTHVRRPRTHSRVKYRGARISRARLRSLRDDLSGTQSTISNLHENFWMISEQDIREMLGKTQQKIGKAVGVLEKAA